MRLSLERTVFAAKSAIRGWLGRLGYALQPLERVSRAKSERRILELARKHDPNDPLEKSFHDFCLARSGRPFGAALADLFAAWVLEEKRNGYFVEFGAADGVLHSNTLMLERDYGWDGILVEPVARNFRTLRKTRTASVQIHGAIDPSFPDRRTTLELVDADQLSCLAEHSAEDARSNERRRIGRRVRVTGWNLNDLLARAPRGHVDFLSVDTEGSEARIVEGIDFDRFTFDVVCVETNHRRDDEAAIRRTLTGRGYVEPFGRHVTGVDLWFVSESRAPALRQSAGAPARGETVASPTWDPAQYQRFAGHRLRPAVELLARVPLAAPRVVYDLGCGSGEATRLLAERWPDAAVHGVDDSPKMLAQAAGHGIRYHEADVRRWAPEEPPDLVFSNAALHWVEDHAALFPRLLGFLSPGGCLAVQMPISWHAPSHRLMRETLEDGGPGGVALGSPALRSAMARKPVEDAAFYHDLLADRARRVDVWETEVLQVLEGRDPVLEWVRGSGLRPVLEGLGDDERKVFLDAYARRLREAYPPRADGRTLYPFRRLFLVAVA